MANAKGRKARKTERCEVLFTPEQLPIIDKKAKNMGMDRGPYLLFCALNARIDIRIGSDPTPAHMRDALRMLDEGLINKDEFKVLKDRILDDDAHGAFKSLERRFLKDRAMDPKNEY